MPPASPARLLRIHVCEGDRLGNKCLYEAIVDKCMALGIAGATVFRGFEGYGDTVEIHRSHVMHHDLPVIVVVVDTPEKIDALMREIEPNIHTGMMACSDVSVIRIVR